MPPKPVDESWKKEWKRMPEFVQEKQRPYAQIIFRFETEADLNEFAKLIDQKLTSKTKSAWYPHRPHVTMTRGRWGDES